MPNRTRPIRKEICLNEQELNLIQHKMRQLGTHNFGAYARKMLIDGYIIKVDYTEQKKLAAAVSRVASNINHVCRRINSTGRCYEDDVAELKARQAEIWELLKVRQRDELSDDHMRNHGFILKADGWHLSPLYDVNLVPEGDELSLCVNEDDATISLDLALEIAPYCEISTRDATDMATDILKTVRENWNHLASKCGLSRNAQEYMRPAFSLALEE